MVGRLAAVYLMLTEDQSVAYNVLCSTFLASYVSGHNLLLFYYWSVYYIKISDTYWEAHVKKRVMLARQLYV